MLFTTVVTLALLVPVIGAMCPPGCQEGNAVCPSKGVPLPKLDERQKNEIRDNSEKIKAFKQNPSLLRRPENQRPIVTLTTQQVVASRESHPGFFGRSDDLPGDFPVTQNKVGRVTRGAGVRICPSINNWDTIVLAINGDGELVQVVQPEDSSDPMQWFLTESCQYTSSKISEATCSEAVRYVNAYVIDYFHEYFKEDWIKVYCCAAYQ